MRAFVIATLVVVTAALARADEPAEGQLHVRSTWRDRVTLGIDGSLRIDGRGAADAGIGIAARTDLGPYAVAASVMRWESLDESVDQHTWQLALRGYRHTRLTDRLRGHVVAGLAYERISTRRDQDVDTASALDLQAGVGLTYKLSDRVSAWTEATLGRRQWLDRPAVDPGQEERAASELMFLFTLGITFD
jgi:hypothetical protein